jgi:hypothetical protein
VLLGEHSHESSGGTSFVSVSGLDVGHGAAGHRCLEWWPVGLFNTVIGEGNASVVEHESDWLCSAVPIEVVKGVFGFSGHFYQKIQIEFIIKSIGQIIIIILYDI